MDGGARGRRLPLSTQEIRMTRTSIWIALALLSAACLDHIEELGPKLTTSPQRRGDPELDATLLQINCEHIPSEFPITACIFDSAGHTYAVDGDIPITPVKPPYGLSFRFDDGPAFTAADLTTEGDDAAIKAYVAPLGTEACGGLPEADEQNRIVARAVPSKDGGLLALVDDGVPAGTQISFTLQFDALLRNHFPLSNPVLCNSPEDCATTGYAARLYVGKEPVLSRQASTMQNCGRK
jgi:hypothetical protein